jgi:hypothetical protein
MSVSGCVFLRWCLHMEMDLIGLDIPGATIK